MGSIETRERLHAQLVHRHGATVGDDRNTYDVPSGRLHVDVRGSMSTTLTLHRSATLSTEAAAVVAEAVAPFALRHARHGYTPTADRRPRGAGRHLEVTVFTDDAEEALAALLAAEAGVAQEVTA